VIHGAEVQPGQYPHVVLVFTNLKCTGTILDAYHVLTAGHCVLKSRKRTTKDSANWTSATETDLVIFDISFAMRAVVNTLSSASPLPQEARMYTGAAALVHTQYDEEATASCFNGYDIAVIRLTRPIRFNRNVLPTCLSAPDDLLPATCEVVGYGSTDNSREKTHNRLMTASDTDWQEEEACRDDASYTLCPWTVLCSRIGQNGQSACRGDSGGPIYCYPVGSTFLKQFGTVQSGNSVCGEQGTYVTITNVRKHLTWLEHVALPMLKNWVREKDVARQRFHACMTLVPDDRMTELAPKMALNLPGSGDTWKPLFCRWLVIYEKCVESLQQYGGDCYYLDEHVMPVIYHDLQHVRCLMSRQENH
jgi:secreted trypsin-like serine protease